MDLTRELLSVLNDPSKVWQSVVAGLAPKPRTVLMTLVALPTPCPIDVWQEAVATLDPEAALTFEDSLRVLDDTFVSIHRRGALHSVWYRNPSVEDFCADYLERNAGFAAALLAKSNDPRHYFRLVGLARATNPGSFGHRYPNLRRLLTKDPETVIERMLANDSTDIPKSENLFACVYMYATTGCPDAVRGKLARTVITHLQARKDFGGYDDPLAKLLEDDEVASSLTTLFAHDLSELRDSIIANAQTIKNYELLGSLDEATGGNFDDWRDDFTSAVESYADNIEGEDDPTEIEIASSHIERLGSLLEVDFSAELQRMSEYTEHLYQVLRDQSPDEEEEDNSERNATRDEINDWFEGLAEQRS